MKTKDKVTLEEALDRISAAAEEMKDGGTVEVDGEEFGLDEPVTLEVESESGAKEAEMEFEIEFVPADVAAAEARPARRRGRALLLGVVAGAALAAGLIAWRRRRSSHAWDEDIEDVGP